MLIYEPVKVLFQVGPIKLFSWGLMVAIGFLVASLLILKEAEKKRFNKDRVANLIIFSIIGAFVGARLVYVLFELDYYIKNPFAIFSVWEGGVVSYGGIIFAVLAAYIYIKAKKESFLKYVDLVAPYIPLGFAIARIGCFLNWCCYGIQSSLPWAVRVGSDFARHPTQLYLLIVNLIVFVILMIIKDKKFFARIGGGVFFTYLLLYSALRLLIEPLRVYQTQAFHWVAYSILALGVVVSVIFFILKKKKIKRR